MKRLHLFDETSKTRGTCGRNSCPYRPNIPANWQLPAGLRGAQKTHDP